MHCKGMVVVENEVVSASGTQLDRLVSVVFVGKLLHKLLLVTSSGYQHIAVHLNELRFLASFNRFLCPNL